jgi:hypothetical protein
MNLTRAIRRPWDALGKDLLIFLSNTSADGGYKFGKLLENIQMTIIEGVGVSGKHFQDARNRGPFEDGYDCNRTQPEVSADFGVQAEVTFRILTAQSLASA